MELRARRAWHAPKVEVVLSAGGASHFAWITPAAARQLAAELIEAAEGAETKPLPPRRYPC